MAELPELPNWEKFKYVIVLVEWRIVKTLPHNGINILPYFVCEKEDAAKKGNNDEVVN